MDTMKYPNTADGDALRNILDAGSDMTAPMSIDFMIAAPDETAGLAIAKQASVLGFQTQVNQDSETGAWTCYCAKTMIPLYETIIHIQDDLDELAKPFGGYSDGWGTLGNKK